MSVSREKLYEEIWAEPITKVSKRYDISDSFLVINGYRKLFNEIA